MSELRAVCDTGGVVPVRRRLGFNMLQPVSAHLALQTQALVQSRSMLVEL